MTQPTVSKHWRKMFKDQASILPGPPHRVTIIQHICSKTVQRKKIHINTGIYAQWNGPSETKPNPENCKNCSSKCAYDCAQLSVHNTAQNSSDNLPSYLQTITIAQMLSIGGKGGIGTTMIFCHRIYNNNYFLWRHTISCNLIYFCTTLCVTVDNVIRSYIYTGFSNVAEMMALASNWHVASQ